MKIAIGSDHAGFALKEELRAYIASLGHEVYDCGTFTTDSVDYPDFAERTCNCLAVRAAAKTAKADPVSKDFPPCDRAVVVCGSGIGISIAANKLAGVRCALCHDRYTAEMCRHHNDANCVAVGGRVIGAEVAKDIVKAFLETEFDGGKHQRRVNMITALEGK